MSGQLFPRDADQIVVDAIVEHDPSHVFVLLSGGNDSTVLTSWARRAFGQKIDAAVFIDTGTSIEPDPEDPNDTTPSVREFVEAFCANRYLPLIVLEAGDAYQRMVRQHGVPGPGAHRYPYVNLKERQIDRLIREHKTRWNDRILLLAGARASESERRMGHAAAVERDGCTVWANPPAQRLRSREGRSAVPRLRPSPGHGGMTDVTALRRKEPSDG